MRTWLFHSHDWVWLSRLSCVSRPTVLNGSVSATPTPSPGCQSLSLGPVPRWAQSPVMAEVEAGKGNLPSCTPQNLWCTASHPARVYPTSTWLAHIKIVAQWWQDQQWLKHHLTFLTGQKQNRCPQGHATLHDHTLTYHKVPCRAISFFPFFFFFPQQFDRDIESTHHTIHPFKDNQLLIAHL